MNVKDYDVFGILLNSYMICVVDWAYLNFRVSTKSEIHSYQINIVDQKFYWDSKIVA